jgi:hypothetical protein
MGKAMDHRDALSRADQLSQVERAAEQTRGLITPAMRADAEIRPGELRWRVTSGRWDYLRRGVPVIVGTPRTWEQMILATVEAAGDDVVASHGTLARLLGHLLGQLEGRHRGHWPTRTPHPHGRCAGSPHRSSGRA